MPKNVNAELREKGVSEEAIEKLQPILRLEGSNEEKLTRLQEILKDSETGLKGVAELSTVFRYLNQLDIQTEIKLRLDTCPRFELLHRSHLRGKSQGRGDRGVLPRRTL